MGDRRRHVERGQESAEPHARGIFDSAGRLMVLMTHNTDIGDSWEEEASNPQYFYEFSTKGYAFGINAIVCAMTHAREPSREPGRRSLLQRAL